MTDGDAVKPREAVRAERASEARTRGAPVRFMTLDPGHFHAALVQRSMYDGVSPEVHVYAPAGFDLDEHLARIERFNRRESDPTRWETTVHMDDDPLRRMIAERPGNVVIIAGRSRGKIDYIRGSVRNGLNVLADKPWIIHSDDLPVLEEVLATAERTGVVAYDIMTERFEVTNALQRELVRDPAIFGSIVKGTVTDPAVRMTSVHHIIKEVAGNPLRRPVWFFDIDEQGEGLADIGTHLVDLSIWTLFPDESLDPRDDVVVSDARRRPTALSRARFTRVTGAEDFPDSLQRWVEDDELMYFANTSVDYALRDVHVHLDVLWDLESLEHGDTHHAIYRGERSRVEVRQGAPEGWLPEVYVLPEPSVAADVAASVRRRIAALQGRWPGLTVEGDEREMRIGIPAVHRLGHEAHFAEVAARFLRYLRDPASLPAWERACMATKYHITTRGTDLSRKGWKQQPDSR